MVEEFYNTNPEIVKCNQSASVIDKINDKKKIIMERAFKMAKERLEHHDGFDKVFERYLQSVEKTIEYISQENEKSAANAFTIKELEKSKKMDLNARVNQMRSYHQMAASAIENNYEACILGKNVKGLTNCQPGHLSASFGLAMEFWNATDPKELKEKSKNIRVKCLKGVSSDAEGVIKKINCLECESKTDPIVALELTKDVTFGKSCPLFKLAAESVNEDKDCLEKFRMIANCSDWSRFSELVTLGTRQLVGSNRDDTGQPNSSKGAR